MAFTNAKARGLSAKEDRREGGLTNARAARFTPENLQAEYDLVSLGEVESVTRRYGDPLKWTVEYKERVPATPVLGSTRKPKSGNQEGLAIRHLTSGGSRR